jgi:predicted 3-demethylubiquinone-9 3-methyltransferase (glyoxalase superfamily)
MQKVTPFLWFDNQAEEAMNFYVSLFPDSKVRNVVRYPDAGPSNNVTVCDFTVAGMEISAMNAGPYFKLNEAFSLVVDCKDQAEVDHYWSKLTADGGEESMCGWLKDKFGVSWQIVPRRLIELTTDPDPAKAKRAMEAMLKMRKINVAEIEAAAKG